GTATNQRFASKNDVKLYRVYLDDPGEMTVQTTGSARVDMAVYAVPDSIVPDKVSIPSSGHPRIVQGIEDKVPYYIAIRPHGRTVGGTFSLVVNGVAHAVVRSLAISPTLYSGHYLTTISSHYDCDDYQFTAPIGGRWKVRIVPTPAHRGLRELDATLLIFDKAG